MCNKCKIGFYVIIFASSLITKAQSDEQRNIEVGFNLSNVSSFTSIRNKTVKKDSFAKAHGVRPSKNFQLNYEWRNDQNSKRSIGICFTDFGFRNSRFDMKENDTLHKDIGLIQDGSQTIQRNAFYNYRFQYLGLQYSWKRNLLFRDIFEDKDFWFCVSGGPSVLVNKDLKIFLPGWTSYGKRTHFIKQEFKSSFINFPIQIAFEMDYLAAKEFLVSVKPNASFLLLGASNSDFRHQMFGYGLQISLKYLMNSKE